MSDLLESTIAIGTSILVVLSVVAGVGSLPVAAAGTTAVSVAPAEVKTDTGVTRTFDIVVETADGGVGAWEATINLTNGSVANITNVTLHGSPGLKTVDIASDNDSVYFDAALADTADNGSVTIATVTVKTTSSGEARLDLAVKALGDEGGASYTVSGTNDAKLFAGAVFEYSGLTLNTTSGTAPVTVSASATVSNVGGSDGTVTVPLFVDGESVATETIPVNAGSSTAVSFTHTFENSGTYNVSVGNTTPRSVTVNGAPTARVSASDTSLNVSEQVTFNASASTDPDGDVLEYAWDFDAADEGGFTDATGAEVTTSFATHGNVTVAVEVRDGQATDVATVTVNVTDRTAPTASFIIDGDNDGNGDATVELGAIALNATTADDNVGIEAYDWTIIGPDDKSTVSGETTTFSPSQVGPYNVTLTVTDVAGNSNTATKSVDVIDTTKPVVRLRDRDVAIVNVTTRFDASESADNGRIVKYRWDFDGDGTIDANTSDPTAEYVYTTANETYTVSVTAIDQSGNANTTSITLETSYAPAVEITHPEQGELLNASRIDVTYRLWHLDVTGQEHHVEYRTDGGDWNDAGKRLGSTPTASGSIPIDVARDGVHTVSVRIVNASDEQLPYPTAVRQHSFTVDTTPPAVDLNLSDGALVTDDATLNATYSDATSGVNRSSVEVRVDGDTVNATVSDGSVRFSLASLSDGEHTLTVAVTDEAGLTTTESITVTIDSTAPSVDRFAVTPTAAVSTYSPARIVANVSDPHPATATLVVEQNQTGTVVFEQSIAAFENTTLTWDATDESGDPVPSGNYTLRLVVNDTLGHRTVVARDVAVDTSPPTIRDVTPSNGSLLATETPLVDAIYRDAAVSTDSGVNASAVRLFVDGSRVPISDVTATSLHAELVGLGIQNPDNSTHTIRVVVVDNASNRATATRTFTIDTRAPAIGLTSNRSTRISTNQPAAITVRRNDAHPGTTHLRIVNASTNRVVDTRTLTHALGDGRTTELWNATNATGTPVPSGRYELLVRSTDAAGNGNTTAITVTVDNELPTIDIETLSTNTVTGVAPTGTIYANGSIDVTAAVNGTPDPAAAVTVVLDARFTNFEATVEAARQEGTWRASVPATALPDDGAYVLKVRATDPARNTNVTTADARIVVDRRPPDASATVSRVNDTAGRVNVTVLDANAPTTEHGAVTTTVTYPNGTSEPITLTHRSSNTPRWTGTFPLAANSTDSTYSVHVTAVDKAGNRGHTTAHTTIRQISTRNQSVTVKLEPSGTFVRFNTTTEVNDTFVTFTTAEVPPARLTAALHGGTFLNGHLGEALSDNLTNATIGIPVASMDLPNGTTPAEATIAYYNTSTETWELKQATTVRTVTFADGTTQQYWLLSVERFSTYGVVVTDDTAPALESKRPQGPLAYDANSATVEFQYSDALSGVAPGQVRLFVDGENVTASENTEITSQSATYTKSDLERGETYTARVEVVDQAGNAKNYTTQFTLPRDTAAPSVTSQSPADGKTFAADTSRVTLEIEFTDRLSGVNQGAIVVRFDGEVVTEQAEITASSVSYTATDLSADSNHTLEVLLVDQAGQSRTVVIPFSIAAPTQGGAGGGGGGGGGSDGSSGPSVAVTKTRDGATVSVRKAGIGAQFTAELPGISAHGITVSELGVRLQFDDSRFRFEVGTPSTSPPNVPSLSGAQALGYVRIRSVNIPASDVASATITFHVSENRLPSGTSVSDVRLYRYHGGEWRALRTTHLGGGRYRATTPGFSVFAVGVERRATTSTPTPTVTSTPTLTPTPTPAATPRPTTSTTATKTTKRRGDGFGAFVAIVALLAIVALARQTRREH